MQRPFYCCAKTTASPRAVAAHQATTMDKEETRHSSMDSQTQDVLRKSLLKLGCLESSVARQDETLKAVQDSLLAVQAAQQAVQQAARTEQQ